MKQLLRLTSYGRKYWPQLLLSVVLMALAGAAQSTVPLLIQPVFDRVLVPNAPAGARSRCCRIRFWGTRFSWTTSSRSAAARGR